MSRVSVAMASDARRRGAANSLGLFASRATTQMGPLRRNPEGRCFPGDLLCRAARQWGPAIGFASLRASHPGKPPSRPHGTRSEVPWMILLYMAVAAAYLSAAWLEW